MATITQQQIELIQISFNSVRPVSLAVAELFYAKLFDLDPSLRSMFKGDMARQGVLLMTMLSTAVDSLSNLPGLVPALTALGARHANYGVIDAHYATVGDALIYTLAAAMGNDFTTELRDAWLALYRLTAEVMQQGANEAMLAAAA